MIQSFFIPGRLPGLNEIIAAATQRKVSWKTRKTRPAYSDMKREWTEIIVAHIKQAKLKPVKAPVFIKYDWWEKDKRRDLDNVAAGKKFINDAFVKAKILPNDNWGWVLGFSDDFHVVKEKPGVIVIIEEREY